MKTLKMYQVATLQSLALGYTKSVITVGELLGHGDIGLGTFEGVDGEMIVLDGHCYQATQDGTVFEAPMEKGVPFCAVSQMVEETPFRIGKPLIILNLKTFLKTISRTSALIILKARLSVFIFPIIWTVLMQQAGICILFQKIELKAGMYLMSVLKRLTQSLTQ